MFYTIFQVQSQHFDLSVTTIQTQNRFQSVSLCPFEELWESSLRNVKRFLRFVRNNPPAVARLFCNPQNVANFCKIL